MATTLKQHYHHGDLRNALLDAAAEIVDTQGQGALTMRGLAAKVGVSRAAPYRHFDNLEQLVVSVGARGFKQLEQQMKEAGLDVEDPVEQVVRFGIAYVQFALAHPVYFRLMFGSGIHDDETRQQLLASGLSSFQLMLGAIQQLQQQGLVAAGNVMDVALPAWSMIHGFASLVANKMIPLGVKPDAAVREYVQRINRIFLYGAQNPR